MQLAVSRTDHTGRCFVSYRRSQLSSIEILIDTMLDCGVPPWQDRRDLVTEPLEPALVNALESTETGSAVLWVSDDVRTSNAIMKVELPTILKKARQDKDFFVHVCLTDGLEYRDVEDLCRLCGILDDLSSGWHVEKIQLPKGAGDRSADGDVSRAILSVDEARRVVEAVLIRRIQKIHGRLSEDEPLKVCFEAHQEAARGYVAGYAVHLNWSRHFHERFAEPQIWSEKLLPSLELVFRAIRKGAPGRAIVVDGRASIAASLALGKAFPEVADIQVSWLQKPEGVLWSLTDKEIESGFVTAPVQRLHMESNDLAVFVSVTGNVEPAVVASNECLPKFRAVVRVSPGDGSGRRQLTSPGQAAHLARMIVAAIRNARHVVGGVKRTHIFMAAPAGLAMLIGRQLNALGPIQTYEWKTTGDDGEGCYVPAALLIR